MEAFDWITIAYFSIVAAIIFVPIIILLIGSIFHND